MSVLTGDLFPIVHFCIVLLIPFAKVQCQIFQLQKDSLGKSYEKQGYQSQDQQQYPAAFCVGFFSSSTC